MLEIMLLYYADLNIAEFPFLYHSSPSNNTLGPRLSKLIQTEPPDKIKALKEGNFKKETQILRNPALCLQITIA